MDPFQVKSALREVALLRRTILEKQRLRGFSGRARALGGCVAFMAGWILYAFRSELSDAAIFWTWGLVFVFAWLLNYGSVVWRRLSSANGNGSVVLRPHLETLPGWIVGGLLTVAIWRSGSTELLYGMWMLLFGLMQMMQRSLLPRQIAWVGGFYLLAGAVCLCLPMDVFRLTPLMGTVFFIGEFVGGIVFHTEGNWNRLAPFFGLSAEGKLKDDE